MTEAPPSKNAEKFVVRLPKGMRKRIAEAARCYRRSMNSEIVLRLERTLAEDDDQEAGDGAASVALSAVAEPEKADADALESRLLALFRRLPAERQRALLALLD